MNADLLNPGPHGSKPSIVFYATRVCPYCQMALALLKQRGVEDDQIQKILVDVEPGKREEMLRLSGGQRTVPQIFIGERHVGGYEDLAKADENGLLKQWLNEV